MKKILAIFSLCALIISCTDPKNDVQDTARLDGLAADCAKLNTTISSLQAVTRALQENQCLTAFTPVTEDSKVLGYLLTLDSSNTVTLYNCPAYVTAGQKDGGWCWMVNGEEVAAGKAPLFKVEGKGMQMSLDGGSSWTEVADETKQLITSVTENANSVEIALEGGAKIVVPKPEKLQVEFISDKKAFTPNEAAYITYKVSGTGDKAVYVETYATNGWTAEIFRESATEGIIKVVAPEDVNNPSVQVFVTTEDGDAYVAPLDISSTSPAPESPVLSSLMNAVSIGCEGGDIEVKVSTNLDYEVIPDSDWVVCKQTKAVREDAVAFEVKANKSEDARSSVIKFKAGNYFTTCVVLQEADYGEVDNEPQTPVDSDLSKNGTANCYIVNVAGSFSFDASVIGNGAAGAFDGARFHIEASEVNFTPLEVEVLWVENECIKDVVLDKTTNRISFNATGNKGNALIAVRDEYEDIAWSWHIWCTNMPKEVSHKNMHGTEYTLMDRNLGAVSVNPNEVEKTHGVMYQWGRKDPFIPSSELVTKMVKAPSNDIWDAVCMPDVPFKKTNNTFEWYNGVQAKIENRLWDTEKSIYDPCPVGYMVPPQETWAGIAASDLQFISQGFFQLLDGGKKVFFPYAGSVDDEDGYSGYYEKSDGSTRVKLYCRLWMTGVANYSGKPVGAQQLQVSFDSKDERYFVDGYVADMRHRLVPVRCMKIQ